jgi:hypothetical protein
MFFGAKGTHHRFDYVYILSDVGDSCCTSVLQDRQLQVILVYIVVDVFKEGQLYD